MTSLLPDIDDAVIDARLAIGELLSSRFASQFGWTNLRPDINAATLITLLDELVELAGHGTNPWTIDGGSITWTGPKVGVVRTDQYGNWLIATGHIDADDFRKATRLKASQNGLVARGDRDIDTDRVGIRHAWMRVDDDTGTARFAAGAYDNWTKVTVWGTGPLDGTEGMF